MCSIHHCKCRHSLNDLLCPLDPLLPFGHIELFVPDRNICVVHLFMILSSTVSNTGVTRSDLCSTESNLFSLTVASTRCFRARCKKPLNGITLSLRNFYLTPVRQLTCAYNLTYEDKYLLYSENAGVLIIHMNG